MNPAPPKAEQVLYGEKFEIHYCQNIADAIRELLSARHLYQSVTVNADFIDGVARQKARPNQRATVTAWAGGGNDARSRIERHYQAEGRKLLQMRWIVRATAGTPSSGSVQKPKPVESNDVDVVLPHITTGCPVCNTRWPFNPLTVDVQQGYSPCNQWICAAYECQNCKREPVRFLIRRSGLKLTLCGRDPIENVEVPGYIPKAAAKYYGGALVAHQSGQTLAGIFLLRVCIEQYWRSLPSVMEKLKGMTKPTGDELGDAYKATLPDDFKDRFPTLTETYDLVSNAMHAASPDEHVFAQAWNNISRHFDAKRVYQIG